MKQVIDMGGFKNETIEVHFGDDIYQVPLDPPIEAYRQILAMQGKKLSTEKEWDNYKGIVATIICKPNPDIDKDKFHKLLTKAAAINFLNPYSELLFKRGGSKNVKRPQKKK